MEDLENSVCRAIAPLNPPGNTSAAAASNLLSAACLLISCFNSSMRGAMRTRIPLHQADNLWTHPAGSCADVVQVPRSSVTLYGHLDQLGPSVKFWRSDLATRRLKHLLESMIVPGLKGKQTVGQVFDVLRKGKCYPFFLGGSVRDQFLDQEPKDADVEVDCDMKTLTKLCLDHWGPENCRSIRGRVVSIGNTTQNTTLEVVDVASTGSTFYVPVFKLEYTVNSMAFDANGNDVIIDLTGTGIVDACRRVIRIPSEGDSLSSWSMWLNNTSGVLYRFWKLRVKGFQAYDDATHRFIVDNAKRRMKAYPRSFSIFYCHYVFQTKYDFLSKKCVMPSKDMCEAVLHRVKRYNKVLAEDLGTFWDDTVVSLYLPSSEDCVSFPLPPK